MKPRVYTRGLFLSGGCDGGWFEFKLLDIMPPDIFNDVFLECRVMILERPSENSEMPSKNTSRWALTLSYDGSRFFGWQKQADGVVSVQAALESALSQIAGETVNVVAAGRTDTGVHATAQVVHFDTAAERGEQSWIRGVNSLLPQGVAVWQAKQVAPHFHARFDAFRPPLPLCAAIFARPFAVVGRPCRLDAYAAGFCRHAGCCRAVGRRT